ncbi:MAG: hydrogenase iron-sulfur subunit [Candidatus Helarchaeota archaeon]
MSILRIGVFVCHCGHNIGAVVDVKRVVEEIKRLPDVEVIDNEYMCSEVGLLLLKNTIQEKNLDGVVIAACSPKMHELLFQDTVKHAGLNQFMVEIANIREQDSWVHRSSPENATKKAVDLIKMAIGKIKCKSPLEKEKLPVSQAVLILGGGVAGVKAALKLADLGIKVYLVERNPSIGGHMAMFDKVFPTLDCAICILSPLMVETSIHEKIELLTLSELLEVKGMIGNFTVKILRKPRFVNENCNSGCIEDCSSHCPIDVPNEFNQFGTRKAIYLQFPQSIPLQAVIDENACIGCRNCEIFCEHDAINYEDKEKIIELKVGAIIVASGYETFDPSKYVEYDEFGYGRYSNVITGLEMERLLSPSGPTKGELLRPSDGKRIEKVAFVQCVGSRDKRIEREYCSRVCCMYAIKQSRQIKEHNPDAEVNVCFIDIRAFGKGYEEFYVKAQMDHNINFIRGRVSEILEDPVTKNLTLRTEDSMLGKIMELDADLVVLSVGLGPDSGLADLIKKLHLPVSPDGFLMEAHPKLRPAESLIPGIFLAGCVQGPKDIQDSVAHASLAAIEAAAIAIKKEIEVAPIAPVVDRDKCLRCKLCISLCDSNAIEFRENEIYVNKASCIGCGVCTAGCPSGALSQPQFTQEQIMAELDALEEKTEYPFIIGFFCNWCSYAAADLAGASRIEYPTNIRIIRVPCTGAVSPLYILHAFEKGADGVLVSGCYEQTCHYRTGFTHMLQREKGLREILSEIGISPQRLRVESASAAEGLKIKQIIEDFTEELLEIGPIGSEFKKEES